jgi:hypothetical protein
MQSEDFPQVIYRPLRRFNLEKQYIVVYRFAPEGPDVYSLAVFSLVRSSVGAPSLLQSPAKVLLPGFVPNGVRPWDVHS